MAAPATLRRMASAPEPIIAAASELNGNGAKQQDVSTPTALAADETVASPAPVVVTRLRQPETPAVETATSLTASAVADLPGEKAPAPASMAVASPQPPAAQPESEFAAGSSTSVPAATPFAELRIGKALSSSDLSAPLTTASLSTTEGTLDGERFSATLVEPARISAVSPKPPAALANPSADNRSIWLDEAATCPRDWVPDDTVKRIGDCAPTTDLIASLTHRDQSALEEAAAMRAEALALLVPRIPSPRPDVAPSVKRVRVSRASSSGWPAAPPPNCGPGKHAKWRFVNHKAGTKEWYCR